MNALLKTVAVVFLLVIGNTSLGQNVGSPSNAGASVTTSSSPDLEMKISAAQPWTDTGLELHPGDVLDLTASPAPTAGAPSAIGQPETKCETSSSGAGSSDKLQLPSASLGALIAKLHSQGGEPFLVGEQKQVKIEEQGHLFLAVNAGSPPLCQQTIAVKVHLVSATVGQTTAPPKDIKSKLATAAQTWLAGQFGTGSTTAATPGTNEASATPNNAASNTNTSAVSKSLNISTAPLDPKLREAIDHLPRRVNDQLKNLGDMVNFVMIGPQKDVQNALQAANWFVADTSNTGAVTKAILMTYEKKDYLQMPMSQLYLFGRVQDYGYEQAEPYAVVASRHHFRLWKAPFQVDGQDVWVGAGTHDIGFEKDQRNGNVTHKIDPAVDGERDHIAESLEKTGLIKTLSYYLPPDPVQEAKNATGGGYRSDGRIVVMWVKSNTTPAVTAGPK